MVIFKSIVSCSVMSDFVTRWTVAHQAPLSMGFSRPEYWRGFAISSSRGSPPPRDQTQVFCIGRWLLASEPPGKPSIVLDEEIKGLDFA